jgi:hypothetical protein
MNRIKKLELKAISDIQHRTELRKRQSQYSLMRTLRRLDLVDDEFMHTNYYKHILRVK